MIQSSVPVGSPVRTREMLTSRTGISADSALLNARRPGADGIVAHRAPGLDQSLLLVDHEDGGPLAAYRRNELSLSGRDPQRHDANEDLLY